MFPFDAIALEEVGVTIFFRKLSWSSLLDVFPTVFWLKIHHGLSIKFPLRAMPLESKESSRERVESTILCERALSWLDLEKLGAEKVNKWEKHLKFNACLGTMSQIKLWLT